MNNFLITVSFFCEIPSLSYEQATTLSGKRTDVDLEKYNPFFTANSGNVKIHLNPVDDDYTIETINQLSIRIHLNNSEPQSYKEAKTREENMQSPRLFSNPANLRTKLKQSEKADLVTLHASSSHEAINKEIEHFLKNNK